jgi:hypothetical protein
MQSTIANLTSASGGQDHTTSPSAAHHVRLTCHPRPSHPRLTCRDDRAYVPLHRGGMAEKIVLICPTRQARTDAADWHDGQFPHDVHAEIACRRRRNAPSCRFITADHDPRYELTMSVDRSGAEWLAPVRATRMTRSGPLFEPIKSLSARSSHLDPVRMTLIYGGPFRTSRQSEK